VIDAGTYREILDLLDQVDVVAHDLLAAELDLYRSLKAKYAGPCIVDFDDKTCLEVILRNVAIRDRAPPP